MRRIYTLIRTFLIACGHVFYPETCMVCQSDLLIGENHLCHECKKITIRLLRKPLCRGCAREMAQYIKQTRTVCKDCLSQRRFYAQCVSLIRYDSDMKNIFHAIKYAKRRTALHIFYDYIHREKNYLEERIKSDIIIPVPISRTTFLKREFNQSEIIAKFLADILRIPLKNNILRRRNKTLPQSTLNKETRIKNIRNAFTAHNIRCIRNKEILLIDDIFTTGNTVNECARILQQAGARRIVVFTLARAV